MRADEAATGAEGSVSDWMLYGDWDNVASMILSLRIHWFEHGTIPTWNFLLCHGRPELSIPYSWAWTWPSLFAYALPPLAAILAVWAVMTLIGFLGTRALLLRWTDSPVGAALGASVYVLSGHFAARFNAGHLTFAFYHWIPLLLYSFDVAFDRVRQRRSVRWPLLAITVVTFLFVSGGLPHPLLHFYPVFLLFVAFRVLRAAGNTGWRPAFGAARVPLAAHGIGVMLAAYKLWPVMAWQRQFPRAGVLFESYSPLEVIANTLTLVTDYSSTAAQASWHVYPIWGYNAFVGPVPWLLALVGLGAVLHRLLRPGSNQSSLGAQGNRAPDAPGTAAFGALLVVVGIALSMGNDNPASPAYLFRHLPFFDGIRAFNRYQGILVFGIAILAAQGMAAVGVWLRRRPTLLHAAWGGLIVGALVPLLVQAVAPMRNIPAVQYSDIVAHHGLPMAQGPPRLVRTERKPNHAVGHQTAILEHGYWIGACRADITLPHAFPRRFDDVEPLTIPPPTELVELRHDRITLAYRSGETEPIRLQLRVLEGFEIDAPSRWVQGWLAVEPGTLENDEFTLTAHYAPVAEGRFVSGLGLAVAGVFFGFAFARELRTTPA